MILLDTSTSSENHLQMANFFHCSLLENTGKPLWKPNKKHQPKGGFDGSIARSARSGVHRGQIMLSQKFKVETFAGAFGERRSARVTFFVSEIM